MKDIIPISILSSILGFVFSYLKMQSVKTIQKDADGFTRLKMNVFYKYYGSFSLFLSALFIVSTALIENKVYIVVGGLAVLLFGGLGLFIFLYFKNHRCTFNEEFVEIVTWRGEKINLRTEEIKRVRMNHLLGHLKLYTSKRNVRLHSHLKGFQTFIDLLEKHRNIKNPTLHMLD